MADAAETWGASSKADRFIRPPGEQKYGRSLSAMFRLGHYAVANTLVMAVDSPEAAQAKIEFYTSVEEGYGTSMELAGVLAVRDFDIRPVIDGRVMSKDLKTSISSMTEAGLICAKEEAKKDMRFWPQLTRSGWDHKNALHVDRMARDETDYNTIIVVSPFVEEAAAESGDAYWRFIGYVPHLKRGFVQLYHMTEKGLVAGSLSFDGSNKHALREILGRYGVQIPEGETTDNWLKYAITRTLTEVEAKALATEIADLAEDPKYKKRGMTGEKINTVDLTKEHKLVMERVFNESYIPVCESLVRGYQTKEVRALIHQLANKAHDFNKHYSGALYRMRANPNQFTDADSVVLHEVLVYSTIEMIRALHLKEQSLRDSFAGGDYNGPHLLADRLQTADSRSFQSMLGGFGAAGARNNNTYSACGNAMALGDEDTSNSPQSTFGGVDGASSGSAESANGACEYEHTGCYCCPYYNDGSNRSNPLKVTARREADGTAYCKRAGCGAWLSADGTKYYIGSIARMAQQRKIAKPVLTLGPAPELGKTYKAKRTNVAADLGKKALVSSAH